MSKKIALMTWYKYCNFGTALQSSALYHVIKNLGYQPTMINYFREKRYIDKDEMTRFSVFKKGLDKVFSLISPHTNISDERKDLFAEYIGTHITETKECNTYPELYALNRDFDAFVCGSDQIWSPLCFDDKYFLSFVEDTNKMVSYAPSIGSTNIANPNIKSRMKNLLERFPNIAVREKQGAEIVNELTGRKAEVVLDPTLLVPADEWDKVIGDKIKRIQGDYIICYYLGDYKRYSKWVQNLSEQLKMPAYVIPVFRNQDGKSVPFAVGPNEFVSLIKNAKYVCTDSYHGMLFAVNYNIPFSVFPRFKPDDPKNQNSRIFSFLEILSLENRLVDLHLKPNKELLTSLDYSNVNQKIELWREKSLRYLSTELERATSNASDATNSKLVITKQCCGCGACASICPKQAININVDSEGFRHYEIDEDLCIKCRQCQTVCPMNTVTSQSLAESINLCSFKNMDSAILAKSSSGAAAYTISSHYNNLGYYICGVTYDAIKREARHEVVEPGQSDQLAKFQGSKYIQSDSANGITETVRLSKTHKVVFFGTPCQVAGLDKALCKAGSRDNAILVDLICHGVPTKYLLEKYLNYIDNKYGTGAYPNVSFRYGKNHWRERYIYIQGMGRNYGASEKNDDFYRFFRRCLCYAASCYECPYREKSSADIRIGDYWGDKFRNDKSGVSMVIVNTKKGNSVIADLSNIPGIEIKQQDLKEYWTVQFPQNPSEPLYRNELINSFMNPNENLHTLADEYCNGYDLLEFLYAIQNFIKRR